MPVACVHVFLSIQDLIECTFRSLAVCVCLRVYICPYMNTLLWAQSDNHSAGSSHSPSVTQSGVCGFSIHPIHSVICVAPELTECGNRTLLPHEITSASAGHQLTGMFQFTVDHNQFLIIGVKKKFNNKRI